MRLNVKYIVLIKMEILQTNVKYMNTDYSTENNVDLIYQQSSLMYPSIYY